MSSNECCRCCICKICQTKNLQNNRIQDPNCSCRMTLDDFVKKYPGLYPGVISNPIDWLANIRYKSRYLFFSRPLEEQVRIMNMFSETKHINHIKKQLKRTLNIYKNICVYSNITQNE